tara:strand:- start:2356 stop:2826 length:471 start_codon:yes stop_codon:yes gene_type:complete
MNSKKEGLDPREIEYHWKTLPTLAELNKANIDDRSTIKVKDHIYDRLCVALGVTKKKLEELSTKRLDKLAAGWFLATWNSTLFEHRDITANYRIPDQYRVIGVFPNYITICLYSGFNKGYEEAPGADVKSFIKEVENIQLKYDDFYLMGNRITSST